MVGQVSDFLVIQQLISFFCKGSQWKSKATLFVCACKPSKTFFPEVLDQYDFGNMKLLDVAITPDASRLVGVGPLLRSPDGLQPSKSRVEKRLIGMLVVNIFCSFDLKAFTIVYNVENKQIEKSAFFFSSCLFFFLTLL